MGAWNKDKGTMSKVNPENYIVIQGWMLTELNLKGTELLIYAIIYGFSQDEDNFYTGSLQYLSDWTNTSKMTVITALKNLQGKGYINKYEDMKNGVKFCRYQSTNLRGIQKTLPGSQNLIPGGGQETLPGGQETLQNNIENNKIGIRNNSQRQKGSLNFSILFVFLFHK